MVVCVVGVVCGDGVVCVVFDDLVEVVVGVKVFVCFYDGFFGFVVGVVCVNMMFC